jgi:hypothetical protein
METQLTWWRAPAWLDDVHTVWDPARAERYNTLDLSLQVAFDLAAVATPREAAAFVAAYGPLVTPPEGPPQELTAEQLLWASNTRLWLQLQHARQQKRPPDLTGEAWTIATATLLAQAPPDTLLGVVHQRLDAIRRAQIPLGLCAACGRFFAYQGRSPRARYCDRACAATAAAWRQTHKGGVPVPTLTP